MKRGKSKNNKTVSLEIRVWYNEKTTRIHLAGRSNDLSTEFITTISPDPTSVRGHPNLYGKLLACLKEAGVLNSALARSE